MLFPTRRLNGLLEPWCQTSMGYLDALLHSDQGPNFESRMFKEVCDILKNVKTRTTPYRPSANGKVERMNRTILQIFQYFIRGQKEDCDLHQATVGMAIRSTVNRQTGFTPNFLMLGREVLQPIDLSRGRRPRNRMGRRRRNSWNI